MRLDSEQYMCSVIHDRLGCTKCCNAWAADHHPLFPASPCPLRIHTKRRFYFLRRMVGYALQFNHIKRVESKYLSPSMEFLIHKK